MSISGAKVGFIGLGVMGKSMAANLQKAGCKLAVFTRTKKSADGIVVAGAQWCNTPSEVAALSDIVFTIVGYPKDVEQVYLGENGLLSGAKQGSILVDMTTSSPILAVRINKEASKKGVAVLDAPVSGGDIGAKNGTLSIMCGGSKEAFDKALPFFNAMGKTVTLMGEAGAGQHTKAANQILVAANLFGAVEAIRYARAVHLDTEKMMQAVSTGAAGSWQLTNNGRKILDNDFAPGFFVKHFLKDLTIALDVAKEEKCSLPMLKLAQETFKAMNTKEFADLGTQVLYKYYEKSVK